MADVANTAQLVALWLATKRSKESHRAYEKDGELKFLEEMVTLPKTLKLQLVQKNPLPD